MSQTPTFTLSVRATLDPAVTSLGRVLSIIGENGADVTATDFVRSAPEGVTRDITILVRDAEHGDALVATLSALDGVSITWALDRITQAHVGGKLTMRNRAPVATRDDLSMAYTPGVARVCMAIHDDPERTWDLTIRGNSVAVITDGSSVVGQGDLGPLAALPAAEAKCMFLREMGCVDGFPLPVDVREADEIAHVVQKITSVFAGVHITDMAAPKCFDVQRLLQEQLDIPVLHDVQEGTAATVLAGLTNSLAVAGKSLADATVVVAGLGPSGVATSRILSVAGVGNVIAVNRDGAVTRDNTQDRPELAWIAEHTNPEGRTGTLSEVLVGADAVVGLTRPGTITPDDIAKMAKDAIVFALSLPDPDISREDALAAGALVYASGRPDLPNQTTSAVAFPGIWRGALDCRATAINDAMVLAAASAIAEMCAESAAPEYILPSVFSADLAPNVARAVRAAAIESGLARLTDAAA